MAPAPVPAHLRNVERGRVAAECADGDVLFFNGQRWMHGVTPMRAKPHTREGATAVPQLSRASANY